MCDAVTPCVRVDVCGTVREVFPVVHRLGCRADMTVIPRDEPVPSDTFLLGVTDVALGHGCFRRSAVSRVGGIGVVRCRGTSTVAGDDIGVR